MGTTPIYTTTTPYNIRSWVGPRWGWGYPLPPCPSLQYRTSTWTTSDEVLYLRGGVGVPDDIRHPVDGVEDSEHDGEEFPGHLIDLPGPLLAHRVPDERLMPYLDLACKFVPLNLLQHINQTCKHHLLL